MSSNHPDNNEHNQSPMIAEIATQPNTTNNNNNDNTHLKKVASRSSTNTTLATQDIKHYPHWEVTGTPIGNYEIYDIFLKHEKKYGFQHDNIRNMFDYLLTMLNSRSARMSPKQALWTLHADYIGGEHSNYRKWYFSAILDLDDKHTPANSPTGLLLEEAKRGWRKRMETMTDHTRISQLALYMLIWGEASVLRFAPELLCFIYHVAEGYDEGVLSTSDTANVGDNGTVNTSASSATTHVISFMDSIIAPLYAFVRDQSYEVINHHYVRKEKDHKNIVGYDDINQLFWNRRAISNLCLRNNGPMLKDIPEERRYLELEHVDWNRAFKKTFYETRSWSHLLTNFSRVWIIHAVSFWYYMASSVDFMYANKKNVYGEINSQFDLPVKLSIVGLGGLVAIVLLAASTLAEFMHLRLSLRTLRILSTRLLFLLIMGACHVAATFYILKYDHASRRALVISSCQLGLGAIFTIFMVVTPPACLFNLSGTGQMFSKTFTANFPEMTEDERFLSFLLWICVFTCKFLETYFFLVLSFRDALSVTIRMQLHNCSEDPLLGRRLCLIMPIVTTVLMFTVELVLFFLDTYLWYVIWSTIFSVFQSMRLGISVMTSWKSLFVKVPINMFKKLTIAAKEELSAPLRRMACSQMWNAIVISMYREHLLSINNLQSLLYQVQVSEDQDGPTLRELHAPPLFDAKKAFRPNDYFPPLSEAERRLSFFAQSLSTRFPTPCSVESMPTFTVFTPHYSEKMILSLREIIREEDSTTRVTLLEYLKKLHPAEWSNFVKDTMFIAEENQDLYQPSDKEDLPFYCIGFKSSAPEYTLRTRLWASLRAQTLYRTINGFMNYSRAIKILYRIEHPDEMLGESSSSNPLVADVVRSGDDEILKVKKTDKAEDRLESIANEKFRYLVAMQRYAKLNQEERANCEFLLTEYPNLQIAYIEEELDSNGYVVYYSVLIDGHCEVLPNNKRAPKYKIRLPGNPILGDGKSDNQNHALIFSRGEFLQLIGTGMGEQLLSREYYYLGTQLPLDRFLTFYYAHPGFHMNNIMIIFAVQVFVFCMTLIGAMAAVLPHCLGSNCFDVHPVYDWLQRCIISIFIVFFIAFLPLFMQELTEKGTGRALLRLIKQFLSLSPMFEVFVTQIYANSVVSNLSFGGARYIATGRGFATSRLPFSVLYSRFAHPSIYFGARTMFMLIFVSLTLWIPHLIYFWATVTSLLISPFVFNPHQFVLMDFICDYQEYLGWLSKGNAGYYHEHAWVTFCRQVRTQVTGNKKKARMKSMVQDSKPIIAVPRAHLSSIFFTEIVMPFLQTALCLFCYIFFKSREQVDVYGTLINRVNTSLGPSGSLGRILGIALGPIVFNAIVLILLQVVSVLSAIISENSKRRGYYIAIVAHGLAVIGLIFFFELFWAIEKFEVRSTLLGLLAIFSVQRTIFKMVLSIFLTREIHHDATNRTWWSGNWRSSKVGRLAAREYVCKIVEMSVFTADFILGHFILFLLFPIALIPSIDKIHSLILFWLRPSKQIRPAVLPTKERRKRKQTVMVYGPIFLFMLLWFVALIIVPPKVIPRLSDRYHHIIKYL
ncbi:Putative Glucan synthase (Fragment) [Rhizopus microsporus]